MSQKVNKNKHRSLYVFLCFWAMVGAGSNLSLQRGSLIEDLSQLMSDELALEDTEFIPLISWNKMKGLYNSYIFPNTRGEPQLAELRHLLRVPHNEMFVTGLVLVLLLDAFQLDRAPRPTDPQLELTIEALAKFHIPNLPYNNSLLAAASYEFNQTGNVWHSEKSDNIRFVFSRLLGSLPPTLVQESLADVDQKQLEMILGLPNLTSADIKPDFVPDFDDCSLNLAIGALLFKTRFEFPGAWQLWNQTNQNSSSVFDALKRYAYRPFSQDVNQNLIDPTSYFYMRTFLDQAWEAGQDIALVPVWLKNREDRMEEYNKGVTNIFTINEIDTGLGADAIYAISLGVLHGLVSPSVLLDKDIAQIYLNTTTLISYVIANNFSGRPDLSIFYYTNTFNFYTFVAKTKHLLESAQEDRVLPLEIMETVYKILQDATEGPMTSDILSKVKVESVDAFYFDNFLGNADLTQDHRPLERGEDRIFSTAAAVNALLSTWAVYHSRSGKHYWKSETPIKVREVVSGSVKWLHRHTLDGTYKPWNAITVSKTKMFEADPLRFPANRMEYLNGSRVDDWSQKPSSPFIYAVEGYIPPDEYAQMLTQPHFGQRTLVDFAGFNGYSNVYYGCSEALTYVTVMSALARFDNTV